jgi:D-amino-acid dehydrogenase
VQRVAIIGAGMVGLSTAWYLQEQGARVTVYDRQHVAAGSSWGNAGWLTPALTAPLPEPAVLSYGVRAVLSPSSPVYVPLRPDPRLLRFLTGFARHSTARRWALGARAYAPITRRALDAFEEMVSAGVDSPTRPADPFLACFHTAEERAALVHELDGVRATGQDVKYTLMTGEEVRAVEPAVSSAVGAAVRIEDQRYLNPPAFLSALASSVHDRDGDIVEGVGVRDVREDADGATLEDEQGRTRSFDAVVLATGAWLGGLARRFGVRRPVMAGRGYSFSVEADPLPHGPVYLASQRVACTPLHTPNGPRLRVAGMMEFRSPDSALDVRRIQAIVEAARPLLNGADLDRREDEWVGSRPVTADGLPLVGATSSRHVFVAGGHGMWGMVLGPVSGKLLAERITTGAQPAELVPFDPLR